MLNTKLYCRELLVIAVLLFPFCALSENEPEQEPNKTIPMEDVQRFSNAISLIKRYYVKNTNDSELFDNAIRGMLSGLDPHSGFLNANELKELQTSTNGEFGGIGIELTMQDGVIKIITPLVDTPSFKAGIKPGDYIIKIGKKSVEGIQLREAVDSMRGAPGSKLQLTILRKGETKPLVFDLVREKIEIKSVQSKLLNKQYAYVRLTQFQALTKKDMESAIESLKKQAGGKIKGMVLDLRNNPGGLFDSAVEISDAFLGSNKPGKKDVIVYTQGRLDGSNFTATSNQTHDLINKAPMVVLINNGSASASEIVAGALKDNKRAIVVGTRSFGKGSVQTILPVDDTRAIKLTTALYFTPSGTSIQAKGITPDIIVEEISVPKTAEKANAFDFSEADLSGHLPNANAQQKNATSSDATIQKEEESLLHEDYQLYAALTVLKGLSLATR